MKREFWREAYYAFIRERPPLRPGEYCCQMMRENVKDQCSDGKHPYGMCSDQVVRTTEKGYGLPVHDGGASYIVIKYCPWCGRKVPWYARS